VVRNPPLPGTWIDAWPLFEMVEVIYALEGREGVLQMQRELLRLDVVPLLLPMLSGILRLFGTSPATLYKRFGDVIKTTMEGIRFQYTATSERSGTMEIEYDTDRTIPECAFLTVVAAMETVQRLCGVPGSVSDPEIRGPRRATYQLAW
jgi:hypothetical protein